MSLFRITCLYTLHSRPEFLESNTVRNLKVFSKSGQSCLQTYNIKFSSLLCFFSSSFPVYFQCTSSLFPVYFQSTSSLIPVYFQSTSSLLLVYFQSTSSLLPVFFQSTSSLLLGVHLCVKFLIFYEIITNW